MKHSRQAVSPHPTFFHHIELQSKSARLLASALSKMLGMRVVSALYTSHGTSYCLQSQQAMIICTSSLEEPCALSHVNPDADFHADMVNSDTITVRAMGLHVLDIAVAQNYLAKTLKQDKAETMKVRQHRMLDVFLPQTLNHVGLRFIESELHAAPHLPSGVPLEIEGFDISHGACSIAPTLPGGIVEIDHVAIDVKSVPEVCERLKEIMGWTFFRVFEEGILQRPIRAITIQSQTAEGLLTIVQPTHKNSIFAHTLKANGGVCVHHIALRCEDILQFADVMSSHGLWETMAAPSREYYEEIRPLAHEFLSDEEFQKLQHYGMLLDFENECALIQVFLPYLSDVPGVFFELIGRIQKRGAPSKEPPPPGCGGFGDRNVTELYDCLVRAVDQWPQGVE